MSDSKVILSLIRMQLRLYLPKTHQFWGARRKANPMGGGPRSALFEAGGLRLGHVNREHHQALVAELLVQGTPL